jgi:putative Mn2+ efflux pump MntP
MDNMSETIYKYVYIAAFPLNAVAILIYILGNGNGSVSVWFPLIVFGVWTFIMFLMGRLIQERFDNTLQMYLLIISCMYLIAAFIPPYTSFWTVTKDLLIAAVIFCAAFFGDGLFESE